MIERPQPVRLHLMHASMQYSDAPSQQREDLTRIFNRATSRNVAWVTGTEAGAQKFEDLIREVAKNFGYKVFARNANDSWVAIAEERIGRRSVEVEYEPLIVTGEGFGHHGPRGVLCVSYDDRMFDTKVTVLAAHYLTRGRPEANSPEYRVNAGLNQKLASKAGSLARKHGVGRALVFYGGDQNIVDRTDDTFMGEPLTSTWDELKKWENTGHGNIDVIASYDHDRRVSAVYSRALDDSEFPLHTDHFVVEAGFDVLPLT